MASQFPNDNPGAVPPPPPPPPSFNPPPPGLPPHASNMIERIKRIIMSPKTEWPAIEAEPMTLNSIMIDLGIAARRDRADRRAGPQPAVPADGVRHQLSRRR